MPGGAGSVVGLVNNISGTRTVTIDTTPRTVGVLNIGDTDGTNAFILTGTTLSFNNNASPAQLNFVSTGSNNTVSAPISILSSTLTISNASSGSQTIGAAPISAGSSGLKTIVIGSTGGGNLLISGTMSDGSGSLALVQNSANAVTQISGAQQYTGGTTLSAGKLKTNNNAAFGTGTLFLNGGTLTTAGTTGRSLQNSLSLGGNVTIGDATDTGSLGFNSSSGFVTLTANSILTVNNTLTFSSSVAGAFSLTKAGSGTMTFSATGSAITGGLTLSAGRLIAANSAGVFGTGTLSLNGGSITSNATTNRTISNAVSVGGDVTIGDATNNGTLTFNGVTALTGNRAITTASDAVFSNTVSGAFSLAKSGTGTLTLSGTNTYSGGTTLNAGRIVVSNAASLGASTGTLTFAGNSGVQLAASFDTTRNAVINTGVTGTVDTNSFNQNISGNLTGLGSLNKSGAGILILSGSNSYSGATTIAGGILNAAKKESLPGWNVNGQVSVASGAGLGVYLGGTGFSAAEVDTLFANVAFASGASWGLDTTNGSATWSANINTPTLGFIKLGSNALTLSGSNNVASVTINSGTLNLGSTTALGSGTLTTTGAATLSTSVDLTGANKITNNVSLLTNLIVGTGSAMELAGSINLNGGRKVITNGNTGVALTISGIIGGDSGGGFGLIPTADVTLSADNTFTGAIDFRGSGVLIVSKIGLAGVAGNLGAGSSIRIGASTTGGNLRYVGNGETTNRTIDVNSTTGNNSIEQAGTGLLRFSGSAVVSGAGAKTLTLLGSTSGTGQLDGNFADNGGALSMVKSGTGKWILGGANTYTGTTTVTAGTLVINGSLSSSPVVVSSGAYLGGSGTISRAVTINSGGHLAPGNSPGILSTGTLTLAGTLDAQLGKAISGSQPVAGTDYDQVNVTGSVTLTGGDLSVSILTGIETNDLYFIIINDLSDPVVGTFNGLAQGATFTLSGIEFQISYTADSVGGTFLGGNDVALLATVPEPESIALLGLGLTVLLWRSRYRRTAG